MKEDAIATWWAPRVELGKTQLVRKIREVANGHNVAQINKRGAYTSVLKRLDDAECIIKVLLVRRTVLHEQVV